MGKASSKGSRDGRGQNPRGVRAEAIFFCFLVQLRGLAAAKPVAGAESDCGFFLRDNTAGVLLGGRIRLAHLHADQLEAYCHLRFPPMEVSLPELRAG